MNLFHNLADGIIEMLDLWFGQGEGSGIVFISLALAVVGFFAAGTIKTRKSKTIVFLAFILLFFLCDFVYLLGGILGHMLSPLIFGAITMLFLGVAVRCVLKFLFARIIR